MKLVLAEDKAHWLMEYANDTEFSQMKISLNRTIRNTFILRKKKGKWKGEFNYLIGSNTIKLGLWFEIKKLCKKHNFPFEIEGLDQAYQKLDYKYVEAFALHLAAKYCPHIAPREDQIDALHKLLTYRNCLADLGTSAGKTFIIFMYVLFGIKHKFFNKVLITCHDADSVIQFAEGFREYAGGKIDLSLGLIYGGSKFKESDVKKHRVVIGNFQALQHKTNEFFHNFSCLIVDEVQKGTNATIQNISKNCINAISRVGLSGTILEDKTADHYTLLTTFGPIVAKITQRELMNIGAAADIKINMINMVYEDLEQKMLLYDAKFGMKAGTNKLQDIDLYHMELRIMRENNFRLKWLGAFISQLDGNALVLFTGVTFGYGKMIVDSVKKNNPGKELYYIDGSVPTTDRVIFKQRMEIGTNKVLVATYQTFGTGKSIKNIRHIVLAEPMKGFVIIFQVIGRGMRLHKDKDGCTMWDLCDDLSIDRHPFAPDIQYNSILNKQKVARQKLYIHGKHPYKVRTVMIKGNAS